MTHATDLSSDDELKPVSHKRLEIGLRDSHTIKFLSWHRTSVQTKVQIQIKEEIQSAQQGKTKYYVISPQFTGFSEL